MIVKFTTLGKTFGQRDLLLIQQKKKINLIFSRDEGVVVVSLKEPIKMTNNVVFERPHCPKQLKKL